MYQDRSNGKHINRMLGHMKYSFVCFYFLLIAYCMERPVQSIRNENIVHQFLVACRNNNLETVRATFDEEALKEINAFTKLGCSHHTYGLQCAAEGCATDVVKYLLSRQEILNKPELKNLLLIPISIRSNCMELTSFLLKPDVRTIISKNLLEECKNACIKAILGKRYEIVSVVEASEVLKIDPIDIFPHFLAMTIDGPLRIDPYFDELVANGSFFRYCATNGHYRYLSTVYAHPRCPVSVAPHLHFSESYSEKYIYLAQCKLGDIPGCMYYVNQILNQHANLEDVVKVVAGNGRDACLYKVFELLANEEYQKVPELIGLSIIYSFLHGQTSCIKSAWKIYTTLPASYYRWTFDSVRPFIQKIESLMVNVKLGEIGCAEAFEEAEVCLSVLGDIDDEVKVISCLKNVHIQFYTFILTPFAAILDQGVTETILDYMIFNELFGVINQYYLA